jgi:hypothetical protein
MVADGREGFAAPGPAGEAGSGSPAGGGDLHRGRRMRADRSGGMAGAPPPKRSAPRQSGYVAAID